MNEQLHDALEALVWDKCSYYRVYGNVATEEEFNADKAKLLRVIELLVEQRNKFADCCDRLMPFDEAIQPFDAELIAALEQGEL